MSIQRLTTWGGDYDFRSSDTAISNGNFYGFEVLEDDTEVSLCSGGDQNNIPSPAEDYLTYLNISGKSLAKGVSYTVPFGEVIKNFDLTTGSVKLYRIARP